MHSQKKISQKVPGKLDTPQQDFVARLQQSQPQSNQTLAQTFRIKFYSLLFYAITLPFFKSYRLRICFADQESRSFFYDGKPTSIVAFWHEYLFLMIPFFSKYVLGRNIPILPLVSDSEDGEMITRLLKPFGFTMIRGSSSRKGLQSIRMIQQALKLDLHTLITPDGPRGPKHEIKSGLPFLAYRNKIPILPIRVVASQHGLRPPERWWRLKKSWDQTLFPQPFSKIVVIVGPAIFPQSAQSFQEFSQQVERQMKTPQAVDSFVGSPVRG